MNYTMKNTKAELLSALSNLEDVQDIKDQRAILVWMLFIFTSIGFIF